MFFRHLFNLTILATSFADLSLHAEDNPEKVYQCWGQIVFKKDLTDAESQSAFSSLKKSQLLSVHESINYNGEKHVTISNVDFSKREDAEKIVKNFTSTNTPDGKPYSMIEWLNSMITPKGAISRIIFKGCTSQDLEK